MNAVESAASGHVSVTAHRAALAALLGRAEVESVPLDRRARGRRCAADLCAADDLPRFDSSAMDGYAALPATPDQRTFPVVGDVPAGTAPDFVLGIGHAARVMTGARLPEGALGVVPVERTDAEQTGPAPAEVTFADAAEPGRHIRRRGEDIALGEAVASTGSVLTPAVIALARSTGCVDVTVHVPTRVAVIATGAELNEPGTDPGPGGIHESNSDMIAALAEDAGCVVTSVALCPDEPETLSRLLDDLDARRRAGELDLVITTGGVSAGAYEVVRQVCEPVPGFVFSHLEMQPGGPQGHGRWGGGGVGDEAWGDGVGTPVVCLPGTPVGAYVSFTMLLRPALDARHGTPPRPAGTAAYDGPTRHVRVGKVQYLSGVLGADGTVSSPPGRRLSGLARADVLIEVPDAVGSLIAGDDVIVHPLHAG